MLETLEVENFGFIEQAKLQFSRGLNVVTGESGTGKSLLLDALGFVLGAQSRRAPFQAQPGPLRVTACFRLETSLDLGREGALGPGASVELARVVELGKSTCYLNRRKVPRAALAETGAKLVERSLQGDAHFLRQEAAQLKLVDSALGLTKLAEEVRTLYSRHAKLSEEKRALEASVERRSARKELVLYQVEELEAQKLEDPAHLEDRLRDLEARIATLGTAEAILAELCRGTTPSTDESLSFALRLVRRNPEWGELETDLVLAAEAVGRVTAELERRLECSFDDRERHKELSAQVAEVRAIARKHRVLPEELGELGAKLRNELEDLRTLEIELENREREVHSSHREALTRATALHEARRAGLGRLTERIAHNLGRLELGASRIELTLREVGLGPHGISNLEMLFRPSPSAAGAPLGQIASGGEISRVLLALLLTAQDHAELLILDEVDAGTGGRTAAAIGATLFEEKENTQVLCVTHSPQLASLAERHFVVSREERDLGPMTRVRALLEDERALELSRMLGDSEAAYQHAQALLERRSKPRLRRVA
jgi:DNA repair protein RecN (Recombination protein N)